MAHARTPHDVQAVTHAPVPRKWRPSLGLMTFAAIAFVLAAPLSGTLFFRIFENQMVRQTEGELIAQAAFVKTIAARELEGLPTIAVPRRALPPPRAEPDDDHPSSRRRVVDHGVWEPIEPALDLFEDRIEFARPDAAETDLLIHPAVLAAGQRISQVLGEAQRTTLAGFLVTDARGVVIAGRADIGRTLAHVDEVQTALNGEFSSVLRLRGDNAERPPLYSISRGARIRVFAAMPIKSGEDVIGVAYLSRTPNNILRALYAERDNVAFASLMTLAATLLVWFVFTRTIARPLGQLTAQAEAIARGERTAIRPLGQHGAREIAILTESILTMAEKLSDRSDYIATLAGHVSHEFKSPLTSIRGAMELLSDPDTAMEPEERARFQRNVMADVERLALLMERLRDLARAENPEIGGTTSLAETKCAVASAYPPLTVTFTGETEAVFAMSRDNTVICLGHLLQNAAQHGAQNVEATACVTGELVRLTVTDDGPGIAPANRAQVFDAFFTTRREEGGTGMGLGIIRALVRAHGGDVTLGDATNGAEFVLEIPRA